jgi:hypothetical protein
MGKSDKSDMKAYRVSKKGGGECVVVAKSLEDAVGALPNGVEARHVDVMESYENAGGPTYGGMTAGTPMPVIVAGSTVTPTGDGTGKSY